MAGAGVLIALKTKAGRALIARVLRITGNLCDKLNRSVTKAIGNDSPRMKKILDLATPAGRLAIGQQAGSKVLDVTDYKEEPS